MYLCSDEEISGGARVLAALLPGAGEWAAARALLASPAERHRLFQRAVAAPPDPTQVHASAGGAAARFTSTTYTYLRLLIILVYRSPVYNSEIFSKGSYRIEC